MKSNLLIVALFALVFTALVSGYTIDGDTVIYENQYGKLTQTPHTLNDFAGDVVINATSYFNATQSLDFALGFDTGNARPTKAWKWSEDVAHDVPSYCDVSYSRQCDTNNFTFTTNPKYAWCYDSNQSVKWEHSFDNGWVDNKTIEWFQNERACTTTQYWDDWTKLSNFNVIEYNDKTWYKVSASFEPGETKSLKVRLGVTPKTTGKYDVLIKRTSDSWLQAFSNGNYVMLDPWWDATWLTRRAINVSDGWNLDRLKEPINVNVTGLNDFTNCSNNRLTWVNGTGDETDLDFMILDNGANGANGTQYCFIQFVGNLSAAGNDTYAPRNVTNYYFYYFNSSSVVRGDSPDLRAWDLQYNGWVNPESDGWTEGGLGVIQNYTYDLANNGIRQINKTIAGDYTWWSKPVTLSNEMTWEIRARVVSNTTDNGGFASWFLDNPPIARRGMATLNGWTMAGHPDIILTQNANWYAETSTTFSTFRLVTDNQGVDFSIFQDGVNKTWGSNMTPWTNANGVFKFGTDYAGSGGIAITEIDYYSATNDGYFPPLEYIVEDAEGGSNYSTINITCYDEQTGNPIDFDLDIYNATFLQEFSNVQQVYNTSINFPQGDVRMDASNTSYYGRSRLMWIGANLTQTVEIYLINATAADVIAVSFHIQTQLGVAISNATVLIERNLNGSIQTVGELKSDFNGDALFYLEVNAPYYLTVTHPNYDSFFGQVNPSQNDYDIILNDIGANATSNYTSFTPTVLDDTYWYLSPFNRRIWNETTNITFYVLSTTSNLTYWGMNISNATNSSIYFQNDTTSVNGGIMYYILNISDFNTSAENITVNIWFSHSPDFNLNALYNLDFNWENWLYPHSLIGARETLYESGLSNVGIAIFVLFITMFIVAWVARMNPMAGLVIAGIILSFFAFSGVFDYTNNGVLIVSGIGVFVISLATAASLIYIRSPT